jgi:hypothetical protein
MGRKTSFARKPFRLSRSLTALCLGCLFSGALFVGLSSISFGADPTTVANIDSALQHVIDYAHNLAQQNNPMAAGPKSLPAPVVQPDGIRLQSLARFDEQGRVLVHVHLDGNQSMDATKRALASLHAQVLDDIASYRHGIIAAYLPIEQIETLARTAGVSHLTAEHPPKAWVGKVTSQGTVVLRTDQVNKLGYKGEGITVGACFRIASTQHI